MVRDGLRLYCACPDSEGTIFSAARYVNSESSWKALRGYAITRVALKNCGAELLHKDGAPHERAVLLLHGGAYIVKLSNIYRGMAVRYSRMAGGCRRVQPGLSPGPEHVFPAVDLTTPWTPGTAGPGLLPENILVVGDSAGGNLALALTLRLRDAAGRCPAPWSACRRGRI